MFAASHPLLDAAHNATHSQNWALAARMFEGVLYDEPQSVPAMMGRARYAMATGNLALPSRTSNKPACKPRITPRCSS